MTRIFYEDGASREREQPPVHHEPPLGVSDNTKRECHYPLCLCHNGCEGTKSEVHKDE